MQVLDRASNGLKRNYTVLISPNEVEEAFVKKLVEKASKIRMDGFRPGKVPLDIIKRLQGEQIRKEAVQELIKAISQKIIKDEGVVVSFNFHTSITKEDEKGLEYSLQFETIPLVDVSPVLGIQLTKYMAETGDKEINDIFDDIRKNHKKWVDQPEETCAEDGNEVSVSLDAKIKVKRNEENIGTDMKIVIGDPNIMDDFWKPLIGKKAGDVVNFSVTYSKQVENKKLAGKTVEYTASVKKVAKATEYELDDEFAKDLGYENFSKLKEWAEERVKARFEELSQSVLKRNLLEKMSEMYTFDVPENMFNIEHADVRRQLLAEAERLGKPMSEAVEKGCRDIASSRVRLGFIVAEISKQNHITVSRGEIAKGIGQLASLYPGHEKAIWDMYSHGAGLNTVVGPILERKVVDYLFKNIKIDEEKCTPQQLIDMDEETFDFFQDESGTSSDTPAEKPKAAKKSAKSDEEKKSGKAKKDTDKETDKESEGKSEKKKSSPRKKSTKTEEN